MEEDSKMDFDNNMQSSMQNGNGANSPIVK
jgi:hypothetical protein